MRLIWTISLQLVFSPVFLAGQTTKSVLADGNIYKLATKQDGVYRLDYSFLEQLGVNPTTIDPRNIQLFGHGGGILPEPNSMPRVDDLAELDIVVSGEDDGSFDSGDFILFYGQSSDQWIRDEVTQYYHRIENPYEDQNFYFLKIGEQAGRRISSAASDGASSYETSSYSARQHHQVDMENLLHLANDANLQGSGRLWVGEQFKTEREKSFALSFDFKNAIISEPLNFSMQFVARSAESSKVFLRVGTHEEEILIASADVGKIEVDYAKIGRLTKEISLQSTSDEVSISYPSLGNNNVGWLDFLEFNFRANLVYGDEQLIFNDLRAPIGEKCSYIITGQDFTIWDIRDPLSPVQIEHQANGSVSSFSAVQDQNSGYVAFDVSNALQAESVGPVPNQNLHGIDIVDYVIIYHPDFTEAVQKLVLHRQAYNQFKIEAVSIDEVFNEFSSGKTDPTAIRDFARLLDRRSDGFKYLLLFGDGSFDFRHLYENLPDHSFIPVYETERSLHPINSFPSDDYYALLDDTEGGHWRGALDIAVGRLPVRTEEEANIVVDKIIKYETDGKFLGDWRVNVLFVADDEDQNRHFRQADRIAEKTANLYPALNVNKVYLDAFEQENTPGGVFNFKATEALNQNMFKGQLVVNYIGHGGANGWAQERVLRKGDIDKWNNSERLPLCITATCSFAGYDDPRRLSAGEYTITHPNGGAIALFTTVRAVYASSNERLTRSVFDHLFEPVNGRMPTIGEILINSKNSNSADTTQINARKFTLLGDPAIRLAIPEYSAITTKINGKSVDDPDLDTLKALSKVTIEGEIVDARGALASNFNGKIYPSIFDKAVILKTLAQDKGSSEEEFKLQKNVIFKGLASVNNGRFQFSFVVPKDINYSFGDGKVSYYAEDGSSIDAGGALRDITVGGTSDQALNDTEGPDIEIFLNDENFMDGGVTDRNPLLLVKLSDENGINVVGNSIGHDLTGVLDQNNQSSIILNDFYESAKDDYTQGTVQYPMTNLELGAHTINVKAWDIANNSSESAMDFVVVDEAQNGLQHVLNYPNPFSTNTSFQFEHQLPDQTLDIKVDILTPSGRLIRTLEEQVTASGFLSRDVKWDGTDEFGDPLGNGIYIYRVSVTAETAGGRILKNTSDLQKLVIIR